MSITIRSIVFNVVFYIHLLFWLIVAIPTFFLPRGAIIWIAKTWGRCNLVLLRVICGIKAEFRGIDKRPPGAYLAAIKHQSTWDTFALLWMFDDPAFIMKRELQWIPLFGWFTIKGRMVPVDRGAGSQALADMTERVRRELAHDRQIVIFPEGTRRAAGAEPRYKYGIVQLYAETGVPVLPIALNSGLFWPRRAFRRVPGTIVVEVLDPIPPGMDKETFFAKLQETIESATARLVDEGRREIGRGT